MFRPRKNSMESFVSPAARTFESVPSSSTASIRRLRSLSQLHARKESQPLPQIPQILVTNSVTVRQKGLAWKIWTRQHLRMTKRTLSIHRNKSSTPHEIIVLQKVVRAERVNSKSHCLRIETMEGKDFYFAFDSDVDLYTWLTDIQMAISSIGPPTNCKRVLHVERDDKLQLVGMPDEWQCVAPDRARDSITHEMVETILPAMTFSIQDEPILDFDTTIPLSRSVSPESHFTCDDEDVPIIVTAQKAIRPATQRLLHTHTASEKQQLRVTIQDYSTQSSIKTTLPTASEDSPSTPLLTPDTSPLTPFRESPYRYRESDAANLTGQIHKESDWAEAHGGYADIWRAKWQTENGICHMVAVKVLRVLSQDEAVQNKIQKKLRKEVTIWHQLRHKNVVQMYGTVDGFSPFISMVSAWYENGNANVYLRKLGDAATVERRLKLLTEVAAGLNYLHNFSFPVVHGDLKGANILVNDQGEAALADFGLSSIIEAVGDSGTSTFSGGSVRWMAPELLRLSPHSTTPKTCASDTYSYGCVILEILTGERPYAHISNDMQVINQLIHGHRPKRPLKPTLNPAIWDLMERCWKDVAHDRPPMALVLSRMEKFHVERSELMLSEDKLAHAA